MPTHSFATFLISVHVVKPSLFFLFRLSSMAPSAVQLHPFQPSYQINVKSNKCPYNIANQIPSESSLTYLRKSVVISKQPSILRQIQTLMGVTGRRWCDFLVYTPHGVHF